MCLYFALMYKTLGGYNWIDLFHPVLGNETIIQPSIVPIVETTVYTETTSEHTTHFDDGGNILTTASDLQTSIQGLKAVSMLFYSFEFIANGQSHRFVELIFRYLQQKSIEVFSVLPHGGRVSFGSLHHH